MIPQAFITYRTYNTYNTYRTYRIYRIYRTHRITEARHRLFCVILAVFLISLVFPFILSIYPAHASVAIKMSMEPVNTANRFIKPGDGVQLRFKLIDMNNENISGIMTDIIFDNQVLSISPDKDVQISPALKDKKTLYVNLVRSNKLRVMAIKQNSLIIPHDSDLFTATFRVIRIPSLLPGTMVYQDASSTSDQGRDVHTTANSFFIPMSDSSMALSSLSGTVSEAGKGVPVAMVGLFSTLQPEIFYQTMTDAAGSYSLPAIVEGTYTLVTAKENYNTSIEKKIVFSNGNSLVKNITLSKGQTVFTFVAPVTPDEGPYYTSRSSITVSGVTPHNTGSVIVQGSVLSTYGAGDLFWYTPVSLKVGDNIINASALDPNGRDLGNSSITITVTSAQKFKITIPSENESFKTESSSLTIGGTVSSEASSIDINGNKITSYTAGQSSWGTMVTLKEGNTIFYCTAKDAAGNMVGTDFISIFYSHEGGGGGGGNEDPLTITTPSETGFYQTGQSTITVGGRVSASTSSLTMNNTPLTNYVASSVSWNTPALTLTEGNNTFTFKSFDGDGSVLGEASILIRYQPGFVDKAFSITIPTQSDTYTAEDQEISIGGETPSNTSQIRVNGKVISGYQAGSTMWSSTLSLESGENLITAFAYNAEGLEIGTDSITIMFSLSFGNLTITQPTEAPFYQTKKSIIRLGGKTSAETTQILIDGQAFSDYQANQTVWGTDPSIPLGTTTFVVMAYDLDNNLVGRDEIIISNPGVLTIESPTTEGDYITGKKKLTLGGTVFLSSDDPVASTVKINGQALASYAAGSPVWEQEMILTGRENNFYVMAYDASDTLIGLDFLKVYWVDPSLIRFRIDRPAQDVLAVKERTVLIEGKTPFTTGKIYRNDTEISFQADDHPQGNLYNIPWTDSVELALGENTLVYQAVDESEQEIGRDGLLVICTGIMRIVEPALTDTMTYTTDEDAIRILLQIDQPSRESTLTINDDLLPSYAGQSTVNYQGSLQEGDNRYVFKLFDPNGIQTGYSAITIIKGNLPYKEKVGEGFCFIRSIWRSSRRIDLSARKWSGSQNVLFVNTIKGGNA
ncbi:MAG: carboxypeptidase regulatory-like domain-containing protein [bacterium]